LTSVFACGGDDDDNDTGADSTDTDPTAVTMTDATMTGATMTDATMTDATMTDATMTDATMTDPTAESSSGDPTVTVTDTDPTAESSSGDPTADSGSSESGGASPECVTYCDLYLTNCAEGEGGSTPYGSEDECFAACAAFSESGLMCRTGHLDGSLTGMPELNEGYYDTHCPHGSADGAGTCID
jgi:hypothetical protein